MVQYAFTKQKQPPEVSYEKSILRNFTKFKGKHLSQGLVLNKVAGLRHATLLKKETLPLVFSCEFCEISKNTFFTDHGRLLRKKSTLYMYGLHSLHKQFYDFYFLTFLLKELIFVNVFISSGPSSRFDAQDIKYFFYHGKDCES